jgi:hypothetical protein
LCHDPKVHLLRSGGVAPNQGEVRCDHRIPRPAEKVTSGKEPKLGGVNRVSLYFDDELASQRANAIEAALRFEWRQREQEIDNTVPPCQPAIHRLPIQAIR